MRGTGTLALTTRMLSGYQVQSGEEVKRGAVSINVEDTGCGIDPEDIAKVFDPFFTKKPGGVGLGLALCHRIIEEHAGKIDVTSTPGQGTSFRVSLPIEIRRKSDTGKIITKGIVEELN
jgi:signal transduction histidine kinase